MSVEEWMMYAVQVLLGIAMAGEGAVKLVGLESTVEAFERFGYPQWFRLVVGAVELIAAAGIFVGVALDPVIAVAGALLVVPVLVGAAGTHLRAGDPPTAAAPAVLLLALALIVATLHAGSLS